MGVPRLGLKVGPSVLYAKDASRFGGGGSLTVLHVRVASLEEGWNTTRA